MKKLFCQMAVVMIMALCFCVVAQAGCFVKFTNYNGTEIWLNPEKFISIAEYDGPEGKTLINSIDNSWYVVKETVKTVFWLLDGSCK